MLILDTDKPLFALLADVDNFEIWFGSVHNFPAIHSLPVLYRAQTELYDEINSPIVFHVSDDLFRVLVLLKVV